MDEPDGTISINQNNDEELDKSAGSPPLELISEPVEVELSPELEVKSPQDPALDSLPEPDVKSPQPADVALSLEPEVKSPQDPALDLLLESDVESRIVPELKPSPEADVDSPQPADVALSLEPEVKSRQDPALDPLPEPFVKNRQVSELKSSTKLHVESPQPPELDPLPESNVESPQPPQLDPSPELDVESSQAPEPDPSLESHVESPQPPYVALSLEPEVKSPRGPAFDPLPLPDFQNRKVTKLVPSPELHVESPQPPQLDPSPESDVESLQSADVALSLEPEVKSQQSSELVPSSKSYVESLQPPEPEPSPGSYVESPQPPQLVPSPELNVESPQPADVDLLPEPHVESSQPPELVPSPESDVESPQPPYVALSLEPEVKRPQVSEPDPSARSNIKSLELPLLELPQVESDAQSEPQTQPEHESESPLQQPRLSLDNESIHITQQQTFDPVQNLANIEPDIHSQAPPPTETNNHSVDERPSDRRLSPVQLIGQWMQSFIHRSTQYISVEAFKRQLTKFPALSNFLKMHTMTFLFILLFVMALANVCVLYLPLVVVLTIAVAKPGQKRQRILLLLSTVYSVSIQLIKIVIIEMDKESKPNCTPQAESKINTPLTYIFGAYSAEDYIVCLLISTFLAGILVIAPSLRAVRKPSVGWDNNTTINNIVLFPEANIKDAGKSFEQCFKFLMTWGFYKFGFELFLIAMVISVHVRMDFVSLITMACAIVTVVCKRFCEHNKFHKWLIIFVRLESVLIILQYTAIVGLPPFACIDYPWKNILTNHTENTNLIVWFDWPDYQHGPNTAFLLLDFIVLLLAGRLFLVLRKESACGLSSGFAQKTSKSDIGQVCLTLMSLVVELGANTTRKKIEEIAGNNKPSDMAISFGINDEDQELFEFVSERKRMFDYMKAVVFKHGFWFTFAIIFIAGVTNSSLFGVAYLSLAVIIAWRGNTLFLLDKKVPSESKWRNYQRKIENNIWLVLLFYSSAVMLIKVLLQFVGCVFVSSLTYACWLRQLLSIVCLDASRGSKVNQDWRYVTGKDSCDVRLTAATTFFDLLCFVCVLLQQRIVESSYFKHCILQFFIESQLQQRGKVIVNARMEYHLKMQRDELDRAQAEAKKKLEDYSNEMKASYTPISYGHTKRAGECLVRQRRHRSNDLNIESDVSQNSNTEETTADKDIPKNDVENEQTEKFQQPSKSTGDSFLNEVNANSAFILEGTTNIIYMVNDELYRWCRDYRFISHFVKQESKPLRCLLLEKTQYMAELEVIEGWRQEAAKCLREVPLSDVNRNEHWHLKEQIKSVQTTLEYTRKEMKNNIANDENYSKKEEELTKTKSELDEQKKTNKEAKDNLKKKEKEIYLLDKEDPKKKKGEIELDEEIRDLNEKIKIWIKNNDAYFGKLNDLKKEKGRFDVLVRQEENLDEKKTTLEASKAILKAKESIAASQKLTNNALILAQDKLRATLLGHVHFKLVAKMIVNSHMATVNSAKVTQIAQSSTIFSKNTADGEANAYLDIFKWQMKIIEPSNGLQNGTPELDAYQLIFAQQANCLQWQLVILNKLEIELNVKQEITDEEREAICKAKESTIAAQDLTEEALILAQDKLLPGILSAHDHFRFFAEKALESHRATNKSAELTKIAQSLAKFSEDIADGKPNSNATSFNRKMIITEPSNDLQIGIFESNLSQKFLTEQANSLQSQFEILNNLEIELNEKRETTLETWNAIVKAKENTIASQKLTNDALNLAQHKLKATPLTPNSFKLVATKVIDSYRAAVSSTELTQIAQSYPIFRKYTIDKEPNSYLDIFNWQMKIIEPSNGLQNGTPELGAYREFLTQQASSLQLQLVVLNEIERKLSEKEETTFEARNAVLNATLKAKESTISSQKLTNNALILAEDKLKATLLTPDDFARVAITVVESYTAAVNSAEFTQIAQLQSLLLNDIAHGESNSNFNILNWRNTIIKPSSDLRNGTADQDAYYEYLTRQAKSLKLQLVLLNKLEREISEKLNIDEMKLPKHEIDVAWRLLKGFSGIIAANTHILCYALVVIDQAASAALLTLPLMILVFAYGALRPPRPTKFVWQALISWTWFVVFAQFLLKWAWLPWNSAWYLAHHGMNEPAFWPYVIGIQPTPVNTLIHIVLLIALCLHREQLQKSGLWEDDLPASDNSKNECQTDFLSTEVDIDSEFNDEKLTLRRRKLKTDGLLTITDQKEQEHKPYTELTQLSWTTHGRSETFLFKLLSGLHFYFRRTIHNKERYALDFFPLQLICYIMILIQVTFWYADFGIVGDGLIILSVMISDLSYVFVIYIGFVFLLLIIDRAIYNASSAFGRIIFHLFMFVSINVYALVVIPWLSGRALVTNYTAMFFYMIFGLYMIASSAQIRHGYPENRQPSLFTRPENKLSRLLFMTYMRIPFAFEIVTFLDFACTNTKLSYRDFFTLETIYARVYELKCIRHKDGGRNKVVDPRSILITLVIAVGIISFVFLVVLFPLILYSFNNVYGTQLYPDRVTVEISVDGFPPLYRMRAEGAADIIPVNETEYQWLLDTFKSVRNANNKKQVQASSQAYGFIDGYRQTDVLKMLLLPKSSEVWTISDASRTMMQKQLMQQSIKPLRLNVNFEFRRERQSIDMDVIVQTSLTHVNLNMATRQAMANMLAGKRSFVTIPKAWPPYAIVPGLGAVRNASLLMKAMRLNSNESFVDLQLQLSKNMVTLSEEWSLKMILPNNSKVLQPTPQTIGTDTYLQQVIFVDKVLPSWMNVGPIKNGIYAIFAGIVMIFWLYMRAYLVRSPLELMLIEIPNVEPLYEKCQDIYLLRSIKPFNNKLEVQMYAQLVHLFRSPAHLIEFTRPYELQQGNE